MRILFPVPLVVLTLALLIAACAPAAPSPTAAPAKPAAQPTAAPAKPTQAPAPKPAEKAAPTTAPAKPAASPAAAAKPAGPAPKVVVGFGSDPDLEDVAAHLAFEDLRKQGVADVTAQNLKDPDIMVKAVVAGSAQIGATGINGMMAANEAGANLRAIVSQSLNEWLMVTPKTITDLSQLQGKRVAHYSETDFIKPMAKEAMDKVGVTPNWIVMGGSEVRAAALLAGQIDATPVSVLDWLGIQEKRPNDFHVLISFKDRVPNLLTTVFFGKADYLQANKQTVRDVVKGLLKVHADIQQDKGARIKEQAPRILTGWDKNLISKATDEYVKMGFWPPDGGVTRAKAEFSVDFYQKAGAIQTKLPVDSFFTDEFLK